MPARLTLGIDPGTATTGYGLVAEECGRFRLVECGVITTPSSDAQPARLKSLYDSLTGIISRTRPVDVAIEQLFVGRNTRAVGAVYQARGVALLAAAMQGLPVGEYTPLQVKRSITRYGRATKHQMQEMVRMLLNLETVPQPDDAADAVAIAICHINATYQAHALASLALASNPADAAHLEATS